MFIMSEAVFVGSPLIETSPPTATFYDPDSESLFTATVTPEQYKALTSAEGKSVPVILSLHFVPGRNHDLTIETVEFVREVNL